MISWGIGRWVLLESEVVFGTRREERRVFNMFLVTALILATVAYVANLPVASDSIKSKSTLARLQPRSIFQIPDSVVAPK